MRGEGPEGHPVGNGPGGGQGGDAVRYAVSGQVDGSGYMRALMDSLVRAMQQHGHEASDTPEGADVVFHQVDPDRPRPFRRRSRATFVVGLCEGPWPDEVLARAYPLMVRSISNMLVYAGADGPSGGHAHLVTPELGCYSAFDAADDDPGEALYRRIAPLATSHLVIDNLFDPDLPQELAEGTPATEQMTRASRTLDSWHLLPAPFPIAQLLPPEDMRHIRHVFGVGGLSYGNLSARHDRHRFWMSASGVDKGKIGTVSRDILLVKTYDPEHNAMRLSVLPDSQPLRVSVDAVEHWGIYERHPEIGAMIHVHAWVDGIAATEINYPCGTIEMGEAMANLLDRQPVPARTIVGLRNHGITATGPNFDDILTRLDGRVRPQVPMH